MEWGFLISIPLLSSSFKKIAIPLGTKHSGLWKMKGAFDYKDTCEKFREYELQYHSQRKECRAKSRRFL